ncbi:CAZyme family GT1 [Penicillium roqueforti]|uniref:CAZyme family GT1 n=1 Tax=Penicillium roqueforti TaxID=5082 RepID=UPI00190B3A11|nr:CAZyme family GT1 [Penicillium roqueforti]KAF9242215.1 CAZyme family GT1 [Penicillium roqueforti]KAI1833381.1 CAZyme family GT1 [Penicillium roqueforti]KAI2675184.1 CAZyme family GT1 [Penicillium roqueforti]KAI2697589.1 CAZyme family GT1 [Penicillium roqueforti]KAI2707868.1 CAZyme family GT1 [Penicillium roqueforti]
MEEPPRRPSTLERNQFTQDGTKVKDDGRIDIDLDSKVGREVSKLIPFLHAEHLQPQPEPSGDFECGLELNIVIQVVGSRGDVQPFVALGNELQRHGHRVRLATHGVFESFVRDSGLEFYSIGGDPSELMAYMVKNPGLIPQMKSIQEGDIQRKRVMVGEILQGCWRSCIEDDSVTKTPFVADAIIANPPSFAHIHCAQALGIPLHMMFTMPWTKPKMANYLSYGIVEWLTWQGLGDVINDWRKSIDLEAISLTEGPRLAETLKIPFTYCWSPTLMPKPTDWPAHIDVCGFFFRAPPDFTPPADLAAFLQSGPPPVYIGFGSIVIEDPLAMTATLVKAVRSWGGRAIISRGWSKLGEEESDDQIFYLEDCPHEWLFQKVAAVVHHGGAGTTACGLRFGRPSLIVPFFGDQLFWGNMVASRGVGPIPIPHRTLNAENLAEAIRFCLHPDTLTAAGDLAREMTEEAGVSAAVASFHRNLPIDKMKCQFLDSEPAVWQLKQNGKTPINLSKMAAGILLENSRIDTRDLKAYETKTIFIMTRRWDPITGGTSSVLGMYKDILTASSDVVIRPYKEITRAHQQSQPELVVIEPTNQSERSPSEGISRTPGTNQTDEDWIVAGKAIGGSAKSVGRIIAYYYKGVLVDIPGAVNEGLRAVPRLYGEEVKDYDNIRDFKSGVAAASDNFRNGFTTGFADIFRQPYEGAQKDGFMGAIRGFVQGPIGMGTKAASGALGLIAYPGQGLAKSLHSAMHSKTRNQLLKARLTESEYLARQSGKAQSSCPDVIEAFEDQQRQPRNSASSTNPNRAGSQR